MTTSIHIYGNKIRNSSKDMKHKTQTSKTIPKRTQQNKTREHNTNIYIYMKDIKIIEITKHTNANIIRTREHTNTKKGITQQRLTNTFTIHKQFIYKQIIIIGTATA